MAKLTFVLGLSGSGKTNIAERLATETGAKLFTDFWRDEDKNLAALRANLDSGVDCIIDEWRYTIPLFRKKILADLKDVPNLELAWICFENDRASADWNVRHRTNKGDVEGHLAINEFLSRVYDCPREAKILNITRINESNAGGTAPGSVSYRLKLTIFLVVTGIIALTEGYILEPVGLQWLLPIIAVTAWAALMVDRRWIR
jgi:hypothetical protein